MNQQETQIKITKAPTHSSQGTELAAAAAL